MNIKNIKKNIIAKKKAFLAAVCAAALTVTGVPGTALGGITEVKAEAELTYNDHLSNYLFMGIDTREAIGEDKVSGKAGQADAIMLVSYDRAEETVKLLAIPRDSIVEIETFNPTGDSLGFSQDHLSIQYGFGDGKHKSCELMVAAVSKLLNDIPIQGYCAINMDGIAPATDEIGGVELTVEDDSLEDINPEFKAGSTVTITGENAEQFVRYRDTNKTQSAIVRQGRQKVFLKAYMEKAQAIAAQDASLATRLYMAVENYMVTNMGNDLFAKLLMADQSGAEMETVPGEGTHGAYFDEYYVDEEALNELVLKMFYK